MFLCVMRTTVELPPELFRKAKARAAQRGETFKALITRAVATELGDARERPAARTRVVLPLVGDPNAPAIPVTAADLERALARDDALRVTRRRRQRRQ
jgi:hypothetical protein